MHIFHLKTQDVLREAQKQTLSLGTKMINPL